MKRQLLELVCLGTVVVGCYLAWVPLAPIVGGTAGLVWLVLTRKGGP